MNQDGGFKVMIDRRKPVYSLLKKPPILKNSIRYISGESTVSPGETTEITITSGWCSGSFSSPSTSFYHFKTYKHCPLVSNMKKKNTEKE